MNEFWARIADSHCWYEFPTSHWFTVFAPLQGWHVQRLGIGAQDQLNGDGSYDCCLKLEHPVRINSTEEALTFCRKTFQEVVGADKDAKLYQSCFDLLGNLEGVLLAPLCRAPNGMIAQPICLPNSLLDQLVNSSRENPVPFKLMEVILISSINSKNIDAAPEILTAWTTAFITQKITMPKKTPKSWGQIGRDAAVLKMLTILVKNGFKKYRNELSAPDSAMDIIAKAARLERIRGMTSYETVKGVVLRRQKV